MVGTRHGTPGSLEAIDEAHTEKREVGAGSLKIKYLLKMIRNRMGYIHIYTCVCVCVYSNPIA